jgi:hypothetical protein
MSELTGKIVHWEEARGYGFIRVAGAEADTFFTFRSGRARILPTSATRFRSSPKLTRGVPTGSGLRQSLLSNNNLRTVPAPGHV